MVWVNRAARRSGWVRGTVGGLARWLAFVEIGLMVLLAVGGRRGSASRMLGAVGTVYVACEALGAVWPRERPFASAASSASAASVANVEPLITHTSGRSFPSRHVASGLAMAVIGGRAHPRLGAAMRLVAWLLGVSRIAAGVHYPSDILAGALLGHLIGRRFAQRA